MLYYDSSKDKDPVTCQDHCYLGLNLQNLNFLRDSTQKTGHLSNTGHARRTTKSIYKKKKNSFLNNQPRINKLAFLSQGSSWELDLRSTLGKTHFTLMGKIHCLGPACPPEYITCTQISSLSLLMVVHLWGNTAWTGHPAGTNYSTLTGCQMVHWTRLTSTQQ